MGFLFFLVCLRGNKIGLSVFFIYFNTGDNAEEATGKWTEVCLFDRGNGGSTSAWNGNQKAARKHGLNRSTLINHLKNHTSEEECNIIHALKKLRE